MEPVVKTFDFQIEQDQFIPVNKTNIIQTLYSEFGVNLSSEDIKILDDGLKLLIQFGPHNNQIPSIKFRKMTDFMTTSGIANITFDDQILKMWLEPEPTLIFVDSNDDRLQIVKAGSDAPKGTIQITMGEGKVYTLLYADEAQIPKAIIESLLLVGKAISTRPMTKDRQVDDQRVSILRKKFGLKGKVYNDRVSFKHPIIEKIVVHV